MQSKALFLREWWMIVFGQWSTLTNIRAKTLQPILKYEEKSLQLQNDCQIHKNLDLKTTHQANLKTEYEVDATS